MTQNKRMITQLAEYYRETKSSLELYQDMNYTVLEEMAERHLAHWKYELKNLILNKEVV